MTRLTEQHIVAIPNCWDSYELRMQERTGLSLFGMACKTLGIDAKETATLVKGKRVAAIPLTQGEGVIGGFTDSLVSIAKHLGFEAETVRSDESGFEDFYHNAYDFAIWANDEDFIVEAKQSNTKFDNDIATGRGFAEALHCMIQKNSVDISPDGVPTNPIVIRGCGPIGTNAALHLAEKGYPLQLFDKKAEKAEALRHKVKNTINSSQVNVYNQVHLEQPPFKHYALVDAAPVAAQADFFGTLEFQYISAPCVPCLWHDNTALWHDALQLGTAVTLVAALVNNSIYSYLF